MANRLLLERIDLSHGEHGKVNINGKDYDLTTKDLPTLDHDHPYELTPAERHVMDSLVDSFTNSRRLQRHVTFLYEQ